MIKALRVIEQHREAQEPRIRLNSRREIVFGPRKQSFSLTDAFRTTSRTLQVADCPQLAKNIHPTIGVPFLDVDRRGGFPSIRGPADVGAQVRPSYRRPLSVSPDGGGK